MTSLILLGWATVVALGARRALTTRDWARSTPRLAIGLWLGAELSVLTAVLGAGLLIALPPAVIATGLDGIIAACARALARLGTPNPTLTVLALAATAVLALRLGVAVAVTFTTARRWRRRHRDALLPVSHVGAEWMTVDHATPVAYCLPGRPGQIVVTSSAIEALTAEELAAVLRHERAHLRGRHHVLVALAAAFHRAFAGLPLAAAAEAEVRRLVEHLADDRACKHHGRYAVATAIVRLADATPVHALGAAAVSVDRVRRMLAPAPRPRIVQRLLAAGAIGVLLAFPATLAAASAGLTIREVTCPRTSHPQPVGVEHTSGGAPRAAVPAGETQPTGDRPPHARLTRTRGRTA